VDGAETVRIFQEEIAVKAKVFTINGFSAHAGQSQLIDWLSHFQTDNMQLFLVHGEQSTQQVLADIIKKRFKFQVFIPDYLEEVTLKPGHELKRVAYPEKAAPRIDWVYILGDMEANLAQLRAHQAQLETKSWIEQTDIRDRILEINRRLMKTISEI
jgi:metallo-beta-lactamase family protein